MNSREEIEFLLSMWWQVTLFSRSQAYCICEPSPSPIVLYLWTLVLSYCIVFVNEPSPSRIVLFVNPCHILLYCICEPLPSLIVLYLWTVALSYCIVFVNLCPLLLYCICEQCPLLLYCIYEPLPSLIVLYLWIPVLSYSIVFVNPCLLLLYCISEPCPLLLYFICEPLPSLIVLYLWTLAFSLIVLYLWILALSYCIVFVNSCPLFQTRVITQANALGWGALGGRDECRRVSKWQALLLWEPPALLTWVTENYKDTLMHSLVHVCWYILYSIWTSAELIGYIEMVIAMRFYWATIVDQRNKQTKKTIKMYEINFLIYYFIFIWHCTLWLPLVRSATLNRLCAVLSDWYTSHLR